MRNVIVIMTCFNRQEKTVACIKSLTAATKDDIFFRFVVVDDNSTDGTPLALQQLSAASGAVIDIVNGTGSLFYTGGMHAGIDYAKKNYPSADYYMLINDDVKFDSDALHDMIMSDTDSVLVGSTCDSTGAFSYGGTLYTKGIKYRSIGPDEPEVDCTTFNANCILLTHKIFHSVKNIDPYYKHGMGDFDYGWQVHRLGYKINVFHRFIGVCDKNPVKGTWNDTTLSRRERLRLKESFKGLPRKDWFHYLNKNFGFTTAVIRSVTPYIKILLGK